jgi:ABC-2 type transport system permease protein
VLELRLFLRDRQQLVFGFFYPAIMMLIFGSVFSSQHVAGGVTYAQYFLAGIAATGIMLTSFQNTAISIAAEREDGTLARLQATTMPSYAYFLGKIALVLASTVAQLALLIAVARTLFAVPLPADSAHWAQLAWVTVLGSCAGTALGIAASNIPKSGKSANVVIVPIALVLQFFSGVFFVYSTLPGWMQQIAAVFPLKWMTQGLRAAVLPNAAATAEVAGSWEHGRTALILLAWVVGGITLSVRTFRWRQT